MEEAANNTIKHWIMGYLNYSSHNSAHFLFSLIVDPEEKLIQEYGCVQVCLIGRDLIESVVQHAFANL